MNDPTRPPGYEFVGIRLLRAHYDIHADALVGEDGQLAFGYSDKVELQGSTVIVRQTVQAGIVNPADPNKPFLQVMVEVEGRFEAGSEVNIEANEFANNHAPAILFAFTREWVYRLTSAATPWPPILLPPMNVIQVRKQVTKPPAV